jgi:type IV pilus assembly protein PilB
MNTKLLKALVEAGVLTSGVADELETEAKEKNVRVERLIYDRNLASQEIVSKAKASVLGVPFKKVNPDDIGSELLSVFPSETARTYRVFPISRTADLLSVGAENPEDSKTQEALRFVAKELKVDLGVYVVTPSAVEGVLKKYSPFQDEINAALDSLKTSRGVGIGSQAGQGLVLLEGDRTVVSGEAPVIKIVAKFLKEAVREKASDIHFEPQRTRFRVRFRIDGQLREISSIPVEIFPPIISRLKILSKLKIDENRVPQDGRFRTELFDREIDFRVATFPTPFGEKVALRVLDPSIGLMGLKDLGVSGKNFELLTGGIEEPYGSILVTGPTGSGKTTTLYALMRILNKDDVNIVSLEDPVEYSIQGVNQSQVKPEIGYTFASGLRQILRQDPDVIMVGEIRDNETAELATHAALTGHVVLSTLHTNNAIGVLPRIMDLGVPPFLLSSTINLMVAQRLIGKLCGNCRREIKNPSPQIVNVLKEEIRRLPEGLKARYATKQSLYQSPGCTKCNNKGRLGRIAIMEVLQMTPELSLIISQGVTINKISEEATRQGMITMRQDGIIKAFEGLVSVEEVLRETSES